MLLQLVWWLVIYLCCLCDNTRLETSTCFGRSQRKDRPFVASTKPTKLLVEIEIMYFCPHNPQHTFETVKKELEKSCTNQRPAKTMVFAEGNPVTIRHSTQTLPWASQVSSIISRNIWRFVRASNHVGSSAAASVYRGKEGWNLWCKVICNTQGAVPNKQAKKGQF